MNKTYLVLLTLTAVLLAANGLLSATALQTGGNAPTWSEQTQSKNSGGPGDTITLSVLAKDDTGLKSASLSVSVDEGAWNTAETQLISGKEALVTFRYTLPNYIPGTRINWNVVIFDEDGNKATTGAKSIIVSDTVPPQVLDQMQEADEVVVGGAILLSARVSDNYKLASASFESNETGTFESIRDYNISEKDQLVSMSWSNPKIKEGTYVGWRVTAKDDWGNKKASDIMVFKVRGCPACPPASEWSNCEVKAGKAVQTQIYYECNENTKFACVLRTRTQNCTPGVSRDEAKNAIDEADLAVAIAKSKNKDTAEAERLLGAARASYEKGEWTNAKSTATEAKTAAETAAVVKPPGPNYLPYLAAVILILIAAGILLKFGKLKLPALGAKPAEKGEEAGGEKPAEKEEEGEACAICGRTFPNLYTCTECGRGVCIDDSRTYEGNVYCTDCLKKKGLM